MSAPRLFHYTCADHGQPGIDRDGYLRPWPQVVIHDDLVWLTDLAEAAPEALGLTSQILYCDRAAVRYEAASSLTCVHWSQYARRLPRLAREALEAAPGAMPAHWWVSRTAVPVVRAAA